LFVEARHKGFSHGLNEEHLSVQGLNPSANGPAQVEAESIPSELMPTEKSVEEALPFANLKIDVDPKGDGTNYQTEIMVEIENRSYRVIADSGATSSGVNSKVVRELDLVNSMLPTDYQYRTSSGHVEKALGMVSLALKIGPILITTPMVVMPEACGYNMLLGNEIMTALQTDIMRSLNLVRFRFGNVIASVPMLPRKKSTSSNSSCVLRIINMTEPWVNNQAPIIELEPKNA
jgi:predicted aspartyl protease